MRRYVIANRLVRLWTLTYAAEVWDYEQVKKDLGRFFPQLRTHRGKAFPYLWVIERHPKGHGLHIHVAMKGYIAKSELQKIWGHGIVHFSDGPSRARRAGHAATGASLASYIAKEMVGYLTKEEAAVDGSHFYDVGQGFQPECDTQYVVIEPGRVLEVIARQYFQGQAPTATWSSESMEEWDGPPVLCGYWR